MMFENFENRIVKIGDKVINHGLRVELSRFNCFLVVGQKRVGKSTLFVPAMDIYKSLGYNVFCNFPMDGAYAIPTIEKYDKKSDMMINTLDKKWLYTHALDRSLVCIDEAEQYYGARDFASWTQADTNWFTETGKHNIVVMLITQYFDLIDINCKRSCDCQVFITRHPWFRNTSYLDFSELASLPVRDKSEVVDIKGARGFVHEDWDVCARHFRTCKLYRKPFYGRFDTGFSLHKQEPLDLFNDCIYWGHILNFNRDPFEPLYDAFDDTALSIQQMRDSA